MIELFLTHPIIGMCTEHTMSFEEVVAFVKKYGNLNYLIFYGSETIWDEAVDLYNCFGFDSDLDDAIDKLNWLANHGEDWDDD